MHHPLISFWLLGLRHSVEQAQQYAENGKSQIQLFYTYDISFLELHRVSNLWSIIDIDQN